MIPAVGSQPLGEKPPDLQGGRVRQVTGDCATLHIQTPGRDLGRKRTVNPHGSQFHP